MNVGVGGLSVAPTRSTGRLSWAVPMPSRPFIAVAVLFLALSFQMLTFTGQLADGLSGSGPALKAYHGIFAGFGLLLISRGQLVRWRPEMAAYFAVVGITALLTSLRFGPNPVMVNMIFAAYAATLGATVGRMAGRSTTLHALRWTSVLVLIAVLLKAVLFRADIVSFLASPFGHPTLPTFYGGGPNLEATWVAMAGVFLIGSRLFLPYMVGSAAICAAYASRAGFIVVVLVIGAAVATAMLRSTGTTRGRRLLLPVAIVAVCVVAVMAARGVEGVDYIAQRFESVGEDPGSMGRLTLWVGGLDVFTAHPFGVGLGNSVPQIERAIAANVIEDNLHNQYLQHLVETGVQGLAVYLLLVGLAMRRLVVSRLRDPMLVYVGLYFLLAMLQFRGAEALLWFVYGLQHGTATLETTNAA